MTETDIKEIIFNNDVEAFNNFVKMSVDFGAGIKSGGTIRKGIENGDIGWEMTEALARISSPQVRGCLIQDKVIRASKEVLYNSSGKQLVVDTSAQDYIIKNNDYQYGVQIKTCLSLKHGNYLFKELSSTKVDYYILSVPGDNSYRKFAIFSSEHVFNTSLFAKKRSRSHSSAGTLVLGEGNTTLALTDSEFEMNRSSELERVYNCNNGEKVDLFIEFEQADAMYYRGQNGLQSD